MDVMKPTLIHIGNRCYRKNPVNTEKACSEQPKRTVEDDVYADEICDAFTHIQHTGSDFTVMMDVPSALFKYIIGKYGETKKKIEDETSTKILIPKPSQKEQEIVIKGHEKRGVLSAKTRVEVLLDAGRGRQPFTHFLSFPLQADDIQQKFVQFKQSVIAVCAQDRGLDESIFANVKKLHLTVGTLRLLNEFEVSRAVEILHQFNDYIKQTFLSDGSPLCVRLHGVEYMNDDPAEVDVLYAKVKGANRLLRLSNWLVHRLSDEGLMHREYENVKLHMTIINSLKRKNGVSSERQSFDATNILKLFADYDFGSQTVDSLHLSTCHIISPDGYYAHATKLHLTA